METIIFLLLLACLGSSTECDVNLPDGVTCGNEFSVHPNPDSCSSFWQCKNECVELIMCPDDYLFSSEFLWCDKPESVDCGDRPAPETSAKPATNTAVYMNTTSNGDCGHILNCDSLADGWYADPYNCRKFWNCDKNLGPLHYTCEEDYLYDPTHKWCDFPDRVDCGDRLICDDECDNNCYHQKTTPQPKTTVTEDSQHCSPFCKYDFGDFELECCSEMFCKCQHGVGFLYPCPSGLVFVEWKDQCDYRSNVQCCNS